MTSSLCYYSLLRFIVAVNLHKICHIHEQCLEKTRYVTVLCGYCPANKYSIHVASTGQEYPP